MAVSHSNLDHGRHVRSGVVQDQPFHDVGMAVAQCCIHGFVHLIPRANRMMLVQPFDHVQRALAGKYIDNRVITKGV